MFKIIKNFEISSILSAVPKNINNNFKFFKKKNFNESRRVIKVLGVKSSFKSKPNTSTVDLFLFAAKKILIKNYIDKSNIGILICVTQTPDYLMPSCSNIVHQKLKLDERCPAYDINLGCSGYVYSLWNIMSVMQSNNIKKGLLLVGDTISKTISKNDMSNNLLFGDAVSATIISYKKKSINYFKLGSAKEGSDKLMIKNSGFKDFNKKNPAFFMDGKEVFNYVISNIPDIIKKIVKLSGINFKKINYYIFHQANKMMLEKIFDNLNISNSKRLYSINKFGNTR